jgi:ubiquinone/menaquinone biosynthesis C-methylase UbiE
MKQREYWQDRIIDWEKACYDGDSVGSLPWIERLANHFRGAVRYRRQLGFDFVARRPRRQLLELGCGSGAFALTLVKEDVVQRVVGVDISSAAVQLARQKAAAAGVSDRVTFLASDLDQLDFATLGDFDYVIGLGLTPYLTDREFERFCRALGDSAFLFDFHRKGVTFTNAAHAFFRLVKGHPFYRRYTQKELAHLLETYGVKNVRWGAKNGVEYVYRESGI